jgi:hypothetical protein
VPRQTSLHRVHTIAQTSRAGIRPASRLSLSALAKMGDSSSLGRELMRDSSTGVSPLAAVAIMRDVD